MKAVNVSMKKVAYALLGCLVGGSVALASKGTVQPTALYFVDLSDGAVVGAHPVQHEVPHVVSVSSEVSSVFVDLSQVLHSQLAGIGGAFNENGGDAFAHLPAPQQQELTSALFSEHNGMGLSFCRTAVGASDFGLSEYSYSETPGDYGMEHFSIDRDIPSVLAFIKAAQLENPALRLFASPWSPPGWMKESGSMDGGNKNVEQNRLRDEPRVYTAYALYFTKYIQAYAAHGVDVDRLLIQNETDMNPKYPGCDMPPDQMAELAFDYIRPAFEAAELQTELWAGTFRGKRKDAETFMTLEGAEEIDGLGLQYCSKNTLNWLRTRYPNTKLMHTEGVCYNGANSMEQARKRFHEVAMWLNGGTENYCYWNMVLNESSSSAWGWKQNSLIKVDRDAGTITYNADFAPISLLSQYIRPGDQSLQVRTNKGIDAIAVQNSQRLVVFLQNDEAESALRTIELSSGEKYNVELPAQALCALVFK